MVEEDPIFRKHDRYKASSYSSYNFKMPSRYDTCFWLWFCQAALWDRTLVDELRPTISSLRILDVGCATGRLLEALAEAGASELFGTDLAPRILEVAREKLSETEAKVELQTADAEDSLPWPSEFFDAVTLTGVLHHFFRPRDALSEIRRVLRPSGRLLITDPCFFPPIRQVLNLALRVAPHDGDYRFYSQRGAVELLERTNFHCLGARRVGLWGYLITAAKPDASRDTA
ncbi:MAG: class I SAM-dependent methyltransferase [Anaerolineales bacterium]|nr:class I SAM-dependent methyltransferase [Anaerolineales bacterium]